MQLIFLLPLVLAFFACAPLPPLGPAGGPPSPQPEPKPQEQEEPEKAEEPQIGERRIIDIGIGLRKEAAVIECPEKKWEFKAGSNLGKTEIETEGDCKYGDKIYRGNWSVLSTDSGLTIINTLPIEDYLKGVVPHEIGRLKQEEFEALKAQAVAARTYAYHHLGSRKSQGFDIYADTRDQVYNGKNEEDSLASEAILATDGLVIKYNGSLIEAYYHSTCGGKTETSEVWGQESKPYLVAVSDSANGRVFCELSKYMKWEEKFGREELVSLFQKNAMDARADKTFSFSKIDQIIVTEKFPGGRAKRLVVFTNKGSFEVFGDRIRRLFAREGKFLPSIPLNISQDKGIFTVMGSGYGHGIGMCQMGTIARAREGQTFEQILKAYYTGVSIEKY
ncbi:MAG: SpoIID/LytB domain-containing protein [Candidatus Fibromonas sp.]|jgi:stage II sporulation protein D|nr:SpoIID/LytB domain-containing protein [Candidatus Fibromonas sp.]